MLMYDRRWGDNAFAYMEDDVEQSSKVVERSVL